MRREGGQAGAPFSAKHWEVSSDVSAPIDARFHELKRKTLGTWVH